MFRQTYIFVLLLAFGCNKVETELPELATEVKQLPPEQSEIYLPLVYNIKRLQELINAEAPDTLYLDNSLANNNNDRLLLRVEQTGKIYLAAENDQLYYNVPVSVWATVDKKLLPALRTKFSLRLKMASRLDIDQNWRVVANTRLIDIEWVRRPKLKVAGLKIDISKITEKVLNEQADKLSDQIDRQLHRHLNLDRLLHRTWLKMQQPLAIAKQPVAVWLVAEPEALAASSLTARNNLISIELRWLGKLRAVMGEKPVVVPQQHLPPLKRIPRHVASFTLNLHTELPFEQLNTILATELTEQKLDLGFGEVRVAEAELLGGIDEIVLRTQLAGAVKGDIYFRGTPYFDPELQELGMSDFDYVVSTEEALLSTADWALHEEFKSNIAGKLRLSIGEEVRQLPQLIHRQIERGRTGSTLDLTIDSMQFSEAKYQVNPDHLQLLLKVEGKSKLVLEELVRQNGT